MKYLLFALLVFWFSTTVETRTNSTESSDSSRIQGVFSFGLGKNFPHSATLKLDYIAGMSACFTWKDLEPLEGKYDFSQIDEQVAWAKKNNKLLNICLYAGNKSPDWLYTKQVPKIQWRRRWKEDQAKMRQAAHEMEEAPLFWDPVYLSYWKKLVTMLAHRYDGNPSIGYITITGATPKDLSTGTVIRYDEDWENIQALGYTHEKHLSAWKNLVEHYVKEFSNTTLVMALGPLRPGTSNLTLSKDLVDYVVQRKYSQIQFLCVILNDTWFETGRGAQELRIIFNMASDHGHPFGYQMVYSAQKMQRFTESNNSSIDNFEDALMLAIEDGASWIEVWHDDIIHPKFKIEGDPNKEYKDEIRKAATLLNSR